MRELIPAWQNVFSKTKWMKKFIAVRLKITNARTAGRLTKYDHYLQKQEASRQYSTAPAFFYRGGTHVFTALTLGGPGDSQVVDTMEEHDVKKRFMHHYNFPPYSAGETGRMGGVNRRMVGHGALAEKALEAVIPSATEFPYTIRLVSECLASNGSTSMGSVCASTLALMDGGVPIKAPVAGIAMGLMLSFDFINDKKYKVLTDIQGPEDEFGDMDFKVAGTRSGITAIQMDIKLDGVPVPILIEALAGAKDARMHILDVIEKEISITRKTISPRAPEILTMKVKPDQIGARYRRGRKDHQRHPRNHRC